MEQTSIFWTLPRELRDEIYAYALDESRALRPTETPQRSSRFHRQRRAEREDVEHISPGPAIGVNSPATSATLDTISNLLARTSIRASAPYEPRRSSIFAGHSTPITPFTRTQAAFEVLLTSKNFFEEAAPYFGSGRTFYFHGTPKLQRFLCGWTGRKVDYGKYITSVTFHSSSFGGIEILLERCPRLRDLNIVISSRENYWLHPDITTRLWDAKSLAGIAYLGELSRMRGLETFTFTDADLQLIPRACVCKCLPMNLFEDRYWARNVKALEEYLRAEVTQPRTESLVLG